MDPAGERSELDFDQNRRLGLGQAGRVTFGDQFFLDGAQRVAKRIHIEPGLARLGEYPLHALIFFADVTFDLFGKHLALGVVIFVVGRDIRSAWDDRRIYPNLLDLAQS